MDFKKEEDQNHITTCDINSYISFIIYQTHLKAGIFLQDLIGQLNDEGVYWGRIGCISTFVTHF